MSYIQYWDSHERICKKRNGNGRLQTIIDYSPCLLPIHNDDGHQLNKIHPLLTTIILFTKIVSNASQITGQEANQNQAVASLFFSMLTKRNRIHTLLPTIILFKESVYIPIRRLPHPRLRCEPNNAPASSFFSFTLSPAPSLCRPHHQHSTPHPMFQEHPG